MGVGFVTLTNLTLRPGIMRGGLFSFFVMLYLWPFLATSQDRCGTVQMEVIRHQQYPRLETTEQFESWMRAKRQARSLSTLGTERTAGITYTIPVVVHIIHNGEAVGNGTNLSDAQIQSQIDVLNNDFQRLNSDASSTPAEFTPVAGNMSIQFVLARQDPNGKATTGITRTKGSQTSWSLSDNALLKSQSYWPAEYYMNIWVANLSNAGVIGYTQLPVSNLGGLANSSNDRLTDGVMIDYKTFGSKAAGGFALDANYDLGRTTTHEVGHFFGLRHIWGDSGCGNDYVDDTPLHTDANYNCPAYPTASICTGTPNMMTMNYMDYTIDRCMNLFTKGQVDRMVIVLENSPRRASLLTSPGASVPVSQTVDAGIRKILSPKLFACAGANTATVRVRNFGTNPIAAGSMKLTVNGALTGTQTYNLATGDSTEISFSGISLSAASQAKFIFETVVTGDGNALNNKDSLTVSVPGNIVAPFVENFNTLPASWSVNNPDGLTTWQPVTTASPSPGNKAMYVHYNQYEEIGALDHLISPWVATVAASAVLRFDVSYAQYNALYKEGLTVSTISGCNKDLSDTVHIYRKFGSDLATSATTTSDYKPTKSSQWRTEVINLDPALLSSAFLLVFTGSSDFGNNLFVTNVQVTGESVDVAIQEWTSPALVTCETSVTPKFVMRNLGGTTINSVGAALTVNGQTFSGTITGLNLAPGAALNITLSAVNLTAGKNELSLNLFSPNNTTDLTPDNNTLTTTVISNQASDFLPLRESFESTTPWVLASNTPQSSWVLNNTNYSSSALYPAFVNTKVGEQSWLVSPVLDLSKAIRASMFYDFSYAVTPGRAVEEIKLLASTDCGTTFSQVLLDNPADQLNTHNSNSAWTPAASTDWSRKFISLDQLVGQKQLRLAFVVTNNNGNNVWLDNVEFFLNDNQNPLAVDPGVALYPGARNAEVNITFNLPTRQTAFLQVYNQTGQLLIANTLPETLNQTYTVDLTDQAGGLYIFRVQTVDAVISRKMLIHH